MLEEIRTFTAVQLAEKIKIREISVIEAVKATLEQMEHAEGLLNAYVTVDQEGALRQAQEVQEKIDNGTLASPLAGVPVAIKDNLCTDRKSVV